MDRMKKTFTIEVSDDVADFFTGMQWAANLPTLEQAIAEFLEEEVHRSLSEND